MNSSLNIDIGNMVTYFDDKLLLLQLLLTSIGLIGAVMLEEEEQDQPEEEPNLHDDDDDDNDGAKGCGSPSGSRRGRSRGPGKTSFPPWLVRPHFSTGIHSGWRPTCSKRSWKGCDLA